MGKNWDEMKLVVMGTGTSVGVPLIGCRCEVCMSENPKDKRFRSSVYIEYRSKKILIDCGPDFRTQMLHNNISNLDAIILTHDHRDHIAGIDDVRALNFIHNKPIPVYCTGKVWGSLEKNYEYIFDSHAYPAAPKIEFHEINNDPFMISDVEIIPVRLKHGEMDIHGFRIGNFSYISDASFIEETEIQKIEKCQVLMINALGNYKHPRHFTLEEALAMIRSIRPQKAYLTHMSHNIGLHDRLRKELPPGIEPAFDGQIICLDAQDTKD
jgi:phosphoribosyl 1,2-cyclic phosphate phosphodiesterase